MPLVSDKAENIASTISVRKSFWLVLLGFTASAVLVIAISRYAASKPCKQCEPGQSVKEESSSGLAALVGPFLVACVSIPALIGTCCWPLLVAMLLGMAQLSTDHSRSIAHSLTWGANFGAMASLLPDLLARTDKTRSHLAPFWHWAPVSLYLLGGLLVMEDLTRHLLLDQGIGTSRLPMYQDNGNLTLVGRIGVACTWIGIALLFISIVWLVKFRPARPDVKDSKDPQEFPEEVL